MRLTIVAEDNMVVVDGRGRYVDCADLVAEGKSALQWYGDWGSEEFLSQPDPGTQLMTRPPNNRITDLAPYQDYVDAWVIEDEKQRKIEEELQRAIEANKVRPIPDPAPPPAPPETPEGT